MILRFDVPGVPSGRPTLIAEIEIEIDGMTSTVTGYIVAA